MKLVKLTKVFIQTCVFAFVLALTFTACTTPQEVENLEDSGELTVNGAQLIHDWGKINIEGGNVTKRFSFSNGSEDETLYLKGAQTSCMCTTAVYHLSDGSVSPAFGMNNNDGQWMAEVAPGESFEVEAIFDPMAHGPDAVGLIQRSVVLLTSDSQQPSLELKVGGDVVYAAEF